MSQPTTEQPRPFTHAPTYGELAAKVELLEAERDELVKDRDQLLKTLTRAKYHLEPVKALLLAIDQALIGQ